MDQKHLNLLQEQRGHYSGMSQKLDQVMILLSLRLFTSCRKFQTTCCLLFQLVNFQFVNEYGLSGSVRDSRGGSVTRVAVSDLSNVLWTWEIIFFFCMA